MAKIAAELKRAVAHRAACGTPGRATPRVIARGEGWTVADVICTSGPGDRAFEEAHMHFSIAVVVAGSFEYRSVCGSSVMTPGSLMLGNAGDSYECGHEHAHGDRCVSFWYAPEYFERIAADAGVRNVRFPTVRLPPLRDLSAVVARASHGAAGACGVPWEELGLTLAGRALRVACRAPAPSGPLPPNAAARVTRTIRAIELAFAAPLTLAALARHAGLSRYHFLRTFEQVTGITPHQYVRRARLRDAAMRLSRQPARVVDVALACGFGDVSNFNHAFRTEFGVSPTLYRRGLHT